MRALPVIAGLLALLGGGLVHGLWTGRWSSSTALADAALRLDALPTAVGGWTSEPLAQDADAIALTGADGYYSRTFRDPKTGERVGVVLLVGKPARIMVHRPEHCYQSAGYELTAPAARWQVTAAGAPPAELWVGEFLRRDAAGGGDQLRIFWSFFAANEWQAPSSPRLRFARREVLYKLYVIRQISGPGGALADDPAVRLLAELLPVLDRALADREGTD